jgi:Family of unknown function (DUF6526)
MAQPQSFQHHARFDPPFHFFIAPVLLLNVIFTIYVVIHTWPHHILIHLWLIVISLVLFAMAGIFRGYALKNQDRLIRLEEQLRLADLLPEDQLDLVDALTIDQFIGLRFASDAEVATLAQRAVAENLNRKQIKQLITTWRPDNQRI